MNPPLLHAVYFNLICQSISRLFCSYVPVFRWELSSILDSILHQLNEGLLKQNYFVAWIIHTKLNNIFKLLCLVPIIISVMHFDPTSAHGSQWLSECFSLYFSVLIFFNFAFLIRTLVHAQPLAPQGAIAGAPRAWLGVYFGAGQAVTDTADSTG